MNERKHILEEVNNLLDTYCTDCFLRAYFRKEYGKNFAQTFCITKCTVGERLKEYGERLK